MRRSFAIASMLSVVLVCFSHVFAQQDQLAGRWHGSIDSIQGQRQATVTIKKESAGYTGAIAGIRPDGGDVSLKEIKLDGDKLTAKSEIEAPQGSIVINYSLVLKDDTLKGKGEIDFGGQTFTLTIDLKRGGEEPAQAPGTRGQGQPQMRVVPQPQQKQSLEYFVGQWNFKWIGRESAFGPAPREGVTTFTLRSDGKALDSRTEGSSETGAFKESGTVTFDDATKMLSFTEHLGNGIQIKSQGDWRSPIAIRFTVEPIKLKSETLALKRTISVVSAFSFTVTEELSENGGPFVRLGNAIYTKAGAGAK
ncbi:MAG: hypothetical protein DMF61_07140 [Blastocatellia bacterium AA13]|nr:MAG: hypothetical protein DMF61_07140 [Blastocatellia bacterium AA13]